MKHATALRSAPGISNGRRRSSSPILIGRERELSLLVEAASNPPAVVVADGEAGVGKTRLVGEMARDRRVAQRRVLVGHCHRLPEPFPLGPVIEALRGIRGEPLPQPTSPLLGALRPLLPELTEQLPPELTPIADPRAERHRTFRALRELLDALGPTVCILEDLHWADEGTLEFVSFIASAPPSELGLVLTYRAEDLPPCSPLVGLTSTTPNHAVGTTFTLAPLSPLEVRELAAAILEPTRSRRTSRCACTSGPGDSPTRWKRSSTCFATAATSRPGHGGRDTRSTSSPCRERFGILSCTASVR